MWGCRRRLMLWLCVVRVALAADERIFDVRVDLQASWPEVQQASAELEWAKRIGPRAGVAFLKSLLALPDERQPYDSGHLAKTFGQILVANRIFSPAVEAQRASCRALAESLGSPCNGSSFAAVYGDTQQARLACSPAELESTLFSTEGAEQEGRILSQAGGRVSSTAISSADLVLFDTTYGLRHKNARFAVMCGCLMDESLHHLLRWAFTSGRQKAALTALPLILSMRQGDCETTSSRDLLSGYAIELRIKSGEYKATDDAAPPASGAKSAVQSSDDDGDYDDDEGATAVASLKNVELAGLAFERLANRFPDLTSELVAFRELLEAEAASGIDSAFGGEDVHRWELENLGLKLVQRVRRSPEPLRTLVSSTENFPTAMAALARGESVKPRWRKAEQSLGLSDPDLLSRWQEAVELNGKQFTSEEDLNTIFRAVEELEEPYVAMAQLGQDIQGVEAILGTHQRHRAVLQNNLSSSSQNSSTVKASKAEKRQSRKAKDKNEDTQSKGQGSAHESTSLWPPTPRRLDWRDVGLRWCYHVRSDEEAEDWPQRLSALGINKNDGGNPYLSMMGGLGHSAPEPLLLQQPVFTIVYGFDPADAEHLSLALNLTNGPSRPARISLLPTTSQDAQISRALSDAFGWILKSGARADALAARKFLQEVYDKPVTDAAGVEALMKKHLPKARKRVDGTWPKAVSAAHSELNQKYLTQKGLALPFLSVNGRVMSGSAKELNVTLSRVLAEEEQELRSAVQGKKLRDGKSPKEVESKLESFLLSGEAGPTAHFFDAALTPGIAVSKDAGSSGLEDVLTATDIPDGSGKDTASKTQSQHVQPESVVLASGDVEALPSFGASGSHAGDSPSTSADSHVVLFLLHVDHVPLLQHFADFIAKPENSRFRVSVASGALTSRWPDCAAALSTCLASSDVNSLQSAVKCCSGEDLAECACAHGAGSSAGIVSASSDLWLQLPSTAKQRVSKDLAARGAVGVCNGRVIPAVPISAHAPALIRAYWCPEISHAIPPLAAAMALTVLGTQTSTPSSHLNPVPVMSRCSLEAPKALRVHLHAKNPALPVLANVAAVVDPLGEKAASLSSIAKLLHDHLNAEVCLALIPKTELTDYPLKRWRRAVYRSPSSSGGAEHHPGVFTRLRTKHTLTLALQTPASWLVTALASEQDLDNIRSVDAVLPSASVATDARPEITATFQLSGLYLEGSAHHEGSGAAATGLQLELLRVDRSAGGSFCEDSDTRVMKNLGFWSMPACPGKFQLALAPGVSNDTFELLKKESEEADEHFIEVTSFRLQDWPMKVKLRPGRKESDLARKTLGVAPRRRAKWRRANRTAKTYSKTAETSDALPAIHVFSLASGHMYERLLAIMVMSVRNHTACPLHFWIVSNFLSPRFTAMVSRLEADLDGVTFHLVSFKWPSWLNPQQDKQRFIWAYKILFLDVLFPMDVPRVIFVDSDLVVRADLRELWELDLQGHAYAFTPFCHGQVEQPDGTLVDRHNRNTTGFRFWDAGYWKSHLREKPYHISALFVVDLLEFRRQAVGDELRATYNMLTRDPSSLANLDQDLPNYAQHTIPIYSLPQEWLWCESWCSESTKALAKAVDLCQNPHTKESKIAMARRIIPEWDQYHARVLVLQADDQSNERARTASRDEL